MNTYLREYRNVERRFVSLLGFEFRSDTAESPGWFRVTNTSGPYSISLRICAYEARRVEMAGPHYSYDFDYTDGGQVCVGALGFLNGAVSVPLGEWMAMAESDRVYLAKLLELGHGQNSLHLMKAVKA